MKITLKEFQLSDAIRILQQDKDRLGLAEYNARVNYWKKAPDQLYGYTGSIGDSIVGCGGIRLFWPKVAEGWALYSVDLKSNIREALYFTKFTINEMFNRFRLHRMQATALIEDDKACRWLECLGFQVESILHYFTADKQDCFMYVKKDVE